MALPPGFKKVDLPPPKVPIKEKRDIPRSPWIADIQVKFSTEFESRHLFFTEDAQEKYLYIREFVEKHSNNECYWEGLLPNHLYAEFNFDIDKQHIAHHIIELEEPEEIKYWYSLIEQHYPQKHRPHRGFKYISDKEFVKHIPKFPAPYHPTGFTKIYHNRYDREMQAVYNVSPGFSTPIPDLKAVQTKIRKIMAYRGKPFVVKLLHKFNCSSILDIQGENLYHLDAIADFELRKYYEEKEAS